MQFFPSKKSEKCHLSLALACSVPVWQHPIDCSVLQQGWVRSRLKSINKSWAGSWYLSKGFLLRSHRISGFLGSTACLYLHFFPHFPQPAFLAFDGNNAFICRKEVNPYLYHQVPQCVGCRGKLCLTRPLF